VRVAAAAAFVPVFRFATAFFFFFGAVRPRFLTLPAFAFLLAMCAPLS
jgi:hypothetical protein